MDKAPNLTLLSFKNQDPFINRLESVEDLLCTILDEEENRELEHCLLNVQQAIFWYNIAFPDIQPPDEGSEPDP